MMVETRMLRRTSQMSRREYKYIEYKYRYITIEHVDESTNNCSAKKRDANKKKGFILKIKVWPTLDHHLSSVGHNYKIEAEFHFILYIYDFFKLHVAQFFTSFNNKIDVSKLYFYLVLEFEPISQFLVEVESLGTSQFD